MNNEFKVLFLGDIVGRIGREAVRKFLSKNKSAYDFVIANVENASHGFGLTEKNHNEFIEYGIDCMTSGNHIWDKKDIFSYIESSKHLIRPLNYHEKAPGVGYRVYDDKIIVINLLGKTYLQPTYCPFLTLEALAKKVGFQDKIVILDFHAEATAEKACMARFGAKLGVKAVLGTHTHVQTADEQIIDGCAYITDAGFCGGVNGVIGMDYEISINRLITAIPERFDVIKSGASQINAVEIIFDLNSGLAKKIERLLVKYEEEKGED